MPYVRTRVHGKRCSTWQRECDCSADHFTRIFRQRVGQTPARFLTHVRMEHARIMLRYTTMSAAQIATAWVTTTLLILVELK